jgi:tRNA-splicing ligase RtcB (3'-phosphate/5'-hydroxy nucleic acid ligase)
VTDMIPIEVRGEVDERAQQQLRTCIESAEDAVGGVLCADGHVGYSQPIGGAVAYRDHISPSGVGYDIGCGNKAVATSLLYSDVRADLPRIMDEIFERISFGVGRSNNEQLDHPSAEVLDRIRKDAPMPGIKDLHATATKQLGTVGAGNHYVDLFRDDKTDRIWVGVHFGSRGFGHSIASGFLALAAGLGFEERVKEGEMDSPPVLLDVQSSLGHLYLESMKLAGDYAYAGRDVVCSKVLEILGAESVDEVHNHHNFAWEEEHQGRKCWVIRKGCTPAFPGQRGFVGATMGEPAVILAGVDSPDSASLLYSTVHGAGRVMSRTQAAGKMSNAAVCSERDCEEWVSWKAYAEERARRGLREDERLSLCPKHPDGKMKKRRIRTKAGAIDYRVVQDDLRQRGIELRGGAADEAPGAYKRLSEVLAYHAGTVEIQHTLIPVGVAMARGDTFDPYKD